MKQFFALAVVCFGIANALPLLTPAVSNGVLLEERASTPTFAKGIRTDCNYEEIFDRDLGEVFAEGDSTVYKAEPKEGQSQEEAEEDAKKEAKVACDDMGPTCGGVVRNGNGEYQLFHGSALKNAPGSTTFLKEICAFPLPYSNFWKGENHHDTSSEGHDVSDEKHDVTSHSAEDEGQGPGAPKRDFGDVKKVYKFNHVTNAQIEGLRWKLSNGPSYARIDDGKDHGAKSRLADGKSEQLSVEDCMKACAKRTDCMSGHYCESGEGAISGKCFLSGDWDPYGIEPDYDGCDQYRNFRQEHEWVKPVMRTDDGEYVKEQWHSKVPIDVAYAQQSEGYESGQEYDTTE